MLTKKKKTEICEREIDDMLIVADAYLFHDLPKQNYDYHIENSVYILSKVGGKKWLAKADAIFTEKVKEAKQKVETLKHDQ